MAGLAARHRTDRLLLFPCLIALAMPTVAAGEPTAYRQEWTRQAIATVERFVGSGRVRPTDLGLIGVLVERLKSRAPASVYVRSRLSPELRHRLDVGQWDGVEASLAAELDALLGDADLGRFAASYARQLPKGWAEWAAIGDPDETVRRRNRVLLDAYLAPALAASGPVVLTDGDVDDQAEAPPAIGVAVGATTTFLVSGDGQYITTMDGPAAPRAFRRQWTPEDVVDWVKHWVAERIDAPPWSDGAYWEEARLYDDGLADHSGPRDGGCLMERSTNVVEPTFWLCEWCQKTARKYILPD